MLNKKRLRLSTFFFCLNIFLFRHDDEFPASYDVIFRHLFRQHPAWQQRAHALSPPSPLSSLSLPGPHYQSRSRSRSTGAGGRIPSPMCTHFGAFVCMCATHLLGIRRKEQQNRIGPAELPPPPPPSLFSPETPALLQKGRKEKQLQGVQSALAHHCATVVSDVRSRRAESEEE